MGLRIDKPRLAAVLAVLLLPLAAGCGGGGGGVAPTPTATPSPTPGNFTVQGTAKYQNMLISRSGLSADPVNQPIRRARVELVRDSNQAVLDWTFTDETGAFSFTRPSSEAATTTYVRVRVQRTVAGEMDVRVTDNSSAVYSMVETPATTGSRTLNLVAPRARPGDVAGPFNIFDQYLHAADTVEAAEAGLSLTALSYVWKVNLADGTYYLPGTNKIYVTDNPPSDTDEFDDSVVLHETGHYFANTLLKDESGGGAHAIGNLLDPRVAFSEGWANFFSGAAQSPPRPYYADTNGGGTAFLVIELETRSTGDSVTYESETAVAQVFWDLFDDSAVSTDGDELDLGFGGVWAAMRQVRSDNAPFVYLHTFLDRAGVSGEALDQNFNAGGVYGGGVPGTYDLDVSVPPLWTPRAGDPPSRTAFPQLLLAVGDTLQSTVTGGSSDGARAAANDFYFLNIVTGGNLTLTLTPDASEDLDLFLYGPNGNRIDYSDDPGPAVETISRAVGAGPHLVQVQAWSATGHQYTLAAGGTAVSGKPAPAELARIPLPVRAASAAGKPGGTIPLLVLELQPVADAPPRPGEVFAVRAEPLVTLPAGPDGTVSVNWSLPEGLTAVGDDGARTVSVAAARAGTAPLELRLAAGAAGRYPVTATAILALKGQAVATASARLELAVGAAAEKPGPAGERVRALPEGGRIIELPARETTGPGR